MFNDKRVAIVHDSIFPHSDAKDALDVLTNMLPNADIFCVADGTFSDRVKAQPGGVAWMKHIAARRTLSAGNVALRSLAVRAMDLRAYDIIVSNCAGLAKGARQRDSAVHICYCHAAASWSAEARLDQKKMTERLLLSPVFAGLRWIDARLATQPDYFIAASRAVAARVKTVYGRNALVIYPPVDTAQYYRSGGQGKYILAISPLVEEIRLDTLVAACNVIAKELWIVGEGPDRKRLESIAGPTVQFVGNPEGDAVRDLLAHCAAVFCPGVGEGFDTLPIKANASGRPAISFMTANAGETLMDGHTGILCRDSSAAGVADAIERCGSVDWDQEALMAHARSFDVSAFRTRFFTLLADVCGNYPARVLA
jgi:glycosyltransferase involved in cell wall biosynthesis